MPVVGAVIGPRAVPLMFMLGAGQYGYLLLFHAAADRTLILNGPGGCGGGLLGHGALVKGMGAEAVFLAVVRQGAARSCAVMPVELLV